jgi:hypothetical protein
MLFILENRANCKKDIVKKYPKNLILHFKNITIILKNSSNNIKKKMFILLYFKHI